jgi:hypothetical protein
MYYSPLTLDYPHYIETKYLRINPSNDTLAAKRAFDNAKNLGQQGGSANGFSYDSLGNVYMLMPSKNAIYIYKSVSKFQMTTFMLTNSISTTLQATPYVRDPCII